KYFLRPRTDSIGALAADGLPNETPVTACSSVCSASAGLRAVAPAVASPPSIRAAPKHSAERTRNQAVDRAGLPPAREWRSAAAWPSPPRRRAHVGADTPAARACTDAAAA